MFIVFVFVVLLVAFTVSIAASVLMAAVVTVSTYSRASMVVSISCSYVSAVASLTSTRSTLFVNSLAPLSALSCSYRVIPEEVVTVIA